MYITMEVNTLYSTDSYVKWPVVLELTHCRSLSRDDLKHKLMTKYLVIAFLDAYHGYNVVYFHICRP
jgi:hypothetical protein